jgi:DNA-binding protein HU-beta
MAKPKETFQVTKAFIAETLQKSAELNGVTANKVAGNLIDAIVAEMKKSGKL